MAVELPTPRPGFPHKAVAVLISVYAEDRWFLDWSAMYVDTAGDMVPAAGGRGGFAYTDFEWREPSGLDPDEKMPVVFAHLKKVAHAAQSAGYPVIGYYTAAYSEGYPKRAGTQDVGDARRFQKAIGGGPVTLKDSYSETVL